MQGREPFALSTFGSFTVAGRRAEVTGLPLRHVRLSRDLPARPVDPNGTYAVDHASVPYFVPEPVGHPPLVFVHGGGMAGTTWEGTPDGREGRLQYFLRWGHPCHVVDDVDRGRAGWFPDPAGPTDGALLRTERVGRCRVVAHSQGGGIAGAAAAATPALVEALVLVAPHCLPDDGGPAGVRQLLVSGDFLDRTPLYRRLRAQWSPTSGERPGPSGTWTCPPPARRGTATCR